VEFEATGEVVGPFEVEFRRDERILRFLTTHMDKYHVEYAEGRRNKAKKEETAKAN
jgi:small subunit ribosomal protein S6